MARIFFVGLDGTEKSYRLQTHRPFTVGRDPGNEIPRDRHLLAVNDAAVVGHIAEDDASGGLDGADPAYAVVQYRRALA